MGSGMHHIVGYYCAQKAIPCLSITASNAEWREFAKWRVQHPDATYTCIEGDIYKSKILPAFQIMSLFHLGEMPDIFGEITAPKLRKLVDRVFKNGQVLFYTGSSAWDRTSLVVKELVDEGKLQLTGDFKHLEIYTK